MKIVPDNVPAFFWKFLGYASVIVLSLGLEILILLWLVSDKPQIFQAELPSRAPATSQVTDFLKPAPPAEGPQPVTPVIKLTSKNTVVFRGPVTSESVSRVQQKAIALSQGLQPTDVLYLVLDTPGGSIEAGNRFLDTLQALPQKVITLTLFSASMGFQIVQNLGPRYILPNGTLMAHPASLGGLDGMVSSDGSGQFATRARWILRQLQVLDQTAASRMGLSLEKFQVLVRDEYWVDGADAVRAHAADQVVLASCDSTLLAGRDAVKLQTMFGALEVSYSACPLLTYPIEIVDQKSQMPEMSPQFRDFLKTMLTDRAGFVKRFILTGEYRNFLK